MTSDLPSKIALATLVASARVGLKLSVMLSTTRVVMLSNKWQLINISAGIRIMETVNDHNS